MYEDLKLERGYESFLDNDYKLKEGLSDFSGKRNIINKKFNTKYFVYYENGKGILKKENQYKPLDIIHIKNFKNKKIIFYCDLSGNISFVILRKNLKQSPSMVIDKLEKNPIYRNMAFMFLSYLWFFGILRSKDSKNFNEMYLSLGYKKSINYKVRFLFPKFIRDRFSLNTNKLSLFLHLYFVRISLKDIYYYYLKSSDINIPVFIKTVSEHANYYYNFKEKVQDKYDKSHYIFNTRSLKISNTEVEMYVRKSVTGQYVLVVTSVLKNSIIFKERLAYWITRLKFNREVYDIYFEKFSQGASESGFELFKHGVEIDKNSIYILDSSNPQYRALKNRYPHNLFAKNSFKSFCYIFLARSFISSDLVSHIQRRLYDNDKKLKKKILQINKKIFLQHGVSLATNLFERGYYNKKVPIAPDYIIVNSQFERNLFMDNSVYKEKELILTGLPNLDLYVRSRSMTKDEITFLLTWRPWDLTGEVKQGSYIYRYLKFIELMKENKFYSNKKVNVILHPKAKLILKEQFEDLYNQNSHLFYEGDIKDALTKSKVLISDYSSVTYMAFSGGTNIVFYWEDKSVCEKEYGSKNILQENIAFGDVVYDFDHLHPVIESNYHSEQKETHCKTFNQLVECSQGKNTVNTYKAISNIL